MRCLARVAARGSVAWPADPRVVARRSPSCSRRLLPNGPPPAAPVAALATPALGLPDGLVYVPDFLTPADEHELLAAIASLPLAESRYRQYTASAGP